MFDTTSRKFPAKVGVGKGLPFVIRLNFDELLSQNVGQISDAVACKKCGGFLAGTNTVRRDPDLGLIYQCVFCGTINKIALRPSSVRDSMEIEIENQPEKDEKEEEPPEPTGRPWIACIDVSGSMQGSRIETVKKSLVTTIESLAEEKLGIHFGLIEFESDVIIRNMLSGEGHMISSDSYASFEKTLNNARAVIDDIDLVEIDSNLGDMRRYINSLSSKSATALGPAMVTALAMCEKFSAERVVLLTDGMANVGIGSFIAPTVEGHRVYRRLASKFNELQTAIDIVGVVSGSVLEIKTLGEMSEATRGQTFFVETGEIEHSMASLRGRRELASDVVIRLVTPKRAKLADMTGSSHFESVEILEKGQVSLGRVDSSSELYLKIDPEQELDEEVSIQLQVSYIDQEGQRKSRIFTRSFEVTTNEKELIDSMDPTLPSTYSVQKSGRDTIASGARSLSDVQAGSSEISKTIQSLERAAEIAKEPSIFRRCIRKLKSFISMRIQESQPQACYCFAPPLRHCAQMDFGYVSAMKASRISREELFS